MQTRALGLAAFALLLLSGIAWGTEFRWANSSQRIYVTGPGSATLTDIKAALPTAPLTLVGPASNRVWYLGVNLFVENGARLNLYGPAIGGDVAELRLKSNNTGDSNDIVELRADWGWLDIRNTRITSWDTAANGPDTETVTYRRAYVRVRSTLDPDGVTAHESRMDILDSEIGYLGSHNTEAYGLVWKVVATATNVPPGTTIFDLVNVYGDIRNSRIHHNFFGVYTYGHYGGQWVNNEVDHNIQYGFDPHDDSDYLVIENNNVHHNGWHGIIASKRCDHGVIRNNLSWSNGLDVVDPHGHGIMLHRSSNDWLIEGNQSYGNADTGISIFACDRTLIRNNLCLSNANAGIRLNVGSANNWIEGNEIGGTHRYGLYLFEGDDYPEPDDDGGAGSVRCHENIFTNNFVSDCTSEFIKVNGADSNTFVANMIQGDSPVLRLQNGTNNLLVGNLLPADTVAKLVGASTNLNSATFKQQPQLALQLDTFSTATFADDEGAIFDVDESNVATQVATHGSSVSLTTAQVGSGTTVTTRNFFVKLNTAEGVVSLSSWSLSGELKKQWTSQMASATARPRFTVGDLAPHNSYAIIRNGQSEASIVSDANGWISFADAPGTTNAIQYAIVPTNQPPTKPKVSVVTTDTISSESGPDRGRFSIRRTGTITPALTIRYSVSGTAQNGTDFNMLSGSITILAEDDSESVTVRPIDDLQLESAESVFLTLTPDPAYDITSDSAALNILDNDPTSLGTPITVIATPVQPQAGQTNGQLQLTWNTVAGLRYRLQFNPDLTTTNWTNLGGSITATNATVTRFDVLSSATQRFYRVMLLP
jgi:parallel beta-helix repeat protein